MMNVGNASCHSIHLNSSIGPISILTLILSLCSCSGNIFVFYLLHKSHSFHSNVRFLLKHFSWTAGLFAASIGYKSMYGIITWRGGLMEMGRLTCRLFDMPWEVIGAATTSSITCIGVERVITTLWKKQFFDNDHPSTMVYTMTVGSWLAALFTITMGTLFALLEHSPLCYCFSTLSIPPIISYILLSCYMLMELGTIACYFLLYHQSRSAYLDFTINTTRHSLSQRHQLMDNMQTTTLLAPVLLIHGATYAGIVFTLMYARASDNIQISVYCAIGIYLAQIIETLLHPTLIISRHEKMRKAAIEYFPILKRFLNVDQPTTTRVENIRENINQRNRGSRTGIIEFRMDPDNHEIILTNLWDQKTTRTNNTRKYDRELPGQMNCNGKENTK